VVIDETHPQDPGRVDAVIIRPVVGL